MNLKDRYKIYPQMEHYDNIASIPSPYLMFKSQNNYRSSIVNTDNNGLRYSGINAKITIDNVNSNEEVNIFTGGSSAFGVGSTSDLKTIPVLLSNSLNVNCLNFSGRAYISTQEFLSFAYFRKNYKKIKNIIIFSGVNDLYNYYCAKYFDKKMGSMFGAENYVRSMVEKNDLFYIFIRPIINKILNSIYGKREFNLISNKNAIKLLLRKLSINEIDKKIRSYNLLNTYSSEPEEVINVIERNLLNWKLFSSNDTKITYILQPMANWLDNYTFSNEEIKVFDILDKIGGQNLKESWLNLNNLHFWYSQELLKICKKNNIYFFDSNILFNKPLNNNIFVDRVHLTDYGYKIIADYILDKLWK